MRKRYFGKHSATELYVHLVFVTKHRKKVFSRKALEALEVFFFEICRDMDCELIECSGEADHVHVVVFYPPKLSVSEIVNRLKGSSSRRLSQLDFAEIREHVSSTGALWSPSYFGGSSGEIPLGMLRDYVLNQDRPT